MTILVVLADRGSEITIDVTSGTTLMQIVQKICAVRQLDPEKYTLKFQNKILDLSLSVFLANLPQNSRIELVIAKQTQGNDGIVTIALQIPAGDRLQRKVESSLSLWEVLRKFEELTGGELNLTNSIKKNVFGPDFYLQPVVSYMNKPYRTMNELVSTTLQSLGISSGSAILKVSLEETKKTLQEHQKELEQSQKMNSQKEISTIKSNSENETIKIIQINSEFSNLVKEEIQQINESKQVDENNYKKSEENSQNLTKNEKDENRVNSSQLDERISNNNDNNNNNNNNSNDNNNSNNNTNSNNTSSSRLLSLATLQIVAPPRNAQILSLNTKQNIVEKEELPDDFYNIKKSDVKTLMSSNQKKEEVLKTHAMRESEFIEKALQHKKATIRLLLTQFQVYLQADFHPLEKISKLFDFVNESFQTPIPPYKLYITPPIQYLDQFTSSTFAELKLSPTATVHLSFQKENGVLISNLNSQLQPILVLQKEKEEKEKQINKEKEKQMNKKEEKQEKQEQEKGKEKGKEKEKDLFGSFVKAMKDIF